VELPRFGTKRMDRGQNRSTGPIAVQESTWASTPPASSSAVTSAHRWLGWQASGKPTLPCCIPSAKTPTSIVCPFHSHPKSALCCRPLQKDPRRTSFKSFPLGTTVLWGEEILRLLVDLPSGHCASSRMRNGVAQASSSAEWPASPFQMLFGFFSTPPSILVGALQVLTYSASFDLAASVAYQSERNIT
jgi:hypothetical protein